MANQITVDILANTRGLTNGINDVNGKLNTLNGQVGKINSAFAGIATIFGAKIGISWFKDAIKGAEDDQKAFASLADLYGADVDKIVKKVNEVSAKFYVDDGQIAQYFVTLKSAFSSEFDKFVPTVVEASATLALLTGKPIEEVIGLWSKALKDGKLTAQEVQKLGIDLTKEQEAKFNSLKTTAERLQFVLDIVAQKQKGVLDNIPAWQKIDYYVGQFKDTIGEKLIPVIEKLVGWYEKLTPGQQELVKGIATFLVVIGGTAAVLAPVLFAFSQLLIIFKELQIAAKLYAATQALLNLAFSPYLVVILAVIAAGVLLYKNWDTVKEYAQILWDKIKQLWSWIKDNWPTLLAILTGPIGLAVKLITDNWDKIRTTISNVFNNIRSLFSGWITSFREFGGDIIQGLINGVNSMIGNAVNAVKNVGTAIKNSIKSLFGIGSPSKVFAEYGKNLMQGLANGIDDSVRLANTAMVQASATITNPFSGPMLTAPTRGNNINVTINAGLGTDAYELGRTVQAALDKYQGVNGRR